MSTNHYLYSLSAGGLVLSGYLKVEAARDAEGRQRARNLILDVADQSGLPVPMPVILETTLDEDGVRDVLAALEEKTPEAAKLRNAKTGMCAIFHEPDHPFMKLH
jgi:hypothetical protein